MTVEYSRLSLDERRLIEQHNNANKSVTWIAKALGRSKSTISEELRRGGRDPKEYMYRRAQSHANLCKQRNKRKAKIQGKLESIIFYYLFEWHCSPQQISGRLKRELPCMEEFHVSHETIYRYIYRSPLKNKITSCLRRKRKKRRRKQRIARGGIRNKVSIHDRPDISDRQEFGHWEGDLIIGKDQKSAMGTLIERSSRYTIIVPLQARDSRSVVNAFSKALHKIPKHLRKSLTYDQGSEMAEHERLSKYLDMPIYFADPGKPQQRGCNENANGLIREYFPKRAELDNYSFEEISRLQQILNFRPKAVLQYATPREVFNLAAKDPELRLRNAI